MKYTSVSALVPDCVTRDGQTLNRDTSGQLDQQLSFSTCEVMRPLLAVELCLKWLFTKMVFDIVKNRKKNTICCSVKIELVNG